MNVCYQEREAYQLARVLLVAAYSQTLDPDTASEPQARLRRSALGAASKLFSWYTEARRRQESTETLLQTLADLSQLSESIDDCTKQGYLSEETAQELHTVQQNLEEVLHRAADT